MVFSNRFYSFRCHSGKSKFINYILFCGKSKTNWSSAYVSRWLLHAISTLGKCYSKLKIKAKLILKALPCGQEAGSASLSEATTSPPFSSSSYFHAPPLFPELLMSNKGSPSKNNGMFLALPECHTSKEDVYPRESQFCKRSSRQEFAITAAEQKGRSLTVCEGHGRSGPGGFPPGGWLPRCCSGI